MSASQTAYSNQSAGLLTVTGLSLGFKQPSGILPVVRDLSLKIDRGECVGLVGESGCGKSLTALAILGLLPRGASVTQGSIELAGCGDLADADAARWNQVRGSRIAAIFQEPGAALNPVLRLGTLFDEVLRVRRGWSRQQARKEAVRLLDLVAMPDAASRLRSYPHELSGGQKQRAMIALALASKPDLLLADEPTTALDVTVQAQILDLLRDLQRELGLAILLISHDLGVVSSCCERVLVMYAGQVVEEGPAEDFFTYPTHPYSQLLLAGVPSLGRREIGQGIPGSVPEPGKLPSGCVFHPRCPSVFDRCREVKPPLRILDQQRASRCWLDEERAGT